MKKIYIFLFIVLSCNNPFSMRDSDTPVNTNMSWIPPSSPYILLDNYKNSIENLNIAYYMRCLDKNFVFIADQNELSPKNPDSWKFKNWNWSIEQEVMSRLFNFFRDTVNFNRRVFDVYFFKTDIKDIESPHDSVVIYRGYEIKIYHNYKEYPHFLSGNFEFHFIEDVNGFWSLKVIKDIKKDSIDWGEFKGKFRY